MKVIINGKEKPINNVTWDDLCDIRTVVDYSQDMHIKWPQKIQEDREFAITEIMRNLC